MSKKTAGPPSIPIPASGRLGSLLRVPVDYLLEVYTDNQITTMIALPNTPNGVTQTRRHATELLHTLGTVVRELTQNHRTDIVLKGVSGYAARSGQTRDGGVIVAGGRTILEEFDRFLDDYQREAAKNVDRVFMVYRALNEGYAFKVEPLAFRWSEDSSENRFSYAWELTLEAYASAPKSPRPSILAPVTEATRKAAQYVAAAAGAVSLAQNALTNTRAEFAEAQNLLNSITSVINTIEGVANEVDGTRSFFTEDLPATWARLTDSYTRAVNAVTEITGDNRLASSAETLNTYALGVAGRVGVNKASFDSATTNARDLSSFAISTQRPRFVREVILRAGDTLQRIAGRAYGDLSRFGEIIEYNGFKDATHHGDGRPLRIGDSVLVPFDTSSADDLGLPRDGDLFGRDLRVDLDGDLILEGGDLAVIEGRTNLDQALRLRLLSEEASSWIFPAYGLPVTVGSALTSRVAAYCASKVSEQLRADARVDAVDDVVVAQEGDALFISATVSPINGGSMSLIVPLGS